nr:hypothetical protein [Providencia stuartii]
MDYEDTIKIGEQLVIAWNNKIKAVYNTFEFGKAHLLCDEDEEEVLITIHQYKENEYKKKIQDFEAEHGSDNIHGLRRHCSGTTLEQQKYRSKTGYTPDGVQGKPTDSTRFINPQDQFEAIEKTTALYNPMIHKDGFVEVNMGRIIAEGYTKDGEYFQTTIVRAGFDRKSGEMYSISGVKGK